MKQVTKELIFVCKDFQKFLYNLKNQGKITEKEYKALAETKINFINKKRIALTKDF